jgi:hypothetical protein
MTALLSPLTITTALGVTAGPVLVLTNGAPRRLTVGVN